MDALQNMKSYLREYATSSKPTKKYTIQYVVWNQFNLYYIFTLTTYNDFTNLDILPCCTVSILSSSPVCALLLCITNSLKICWRGGLTSSTILKTRKNLNALNYYIVFTKMILAKQYPLTILYTNNTNILILCKH